MDLKFCVRNKESAGNGLHRYLATCTIAILFFTGHAHASTINYHGRILRPNGSPVQDLNVEFRVQIRTPGNENCLLTEETVFAPVVNGLFSLPIGSNTRTDSYSANWSFDQALSNRTSFSALNAGDCALPGGYTALPGDGRKISVLFKETSMASFETMPIQALNYAPMAIESKYVSGYGSGSLLKIEGIDNRTTLSGAQLTELVALTNGNYVRSSGATGAIVPVLSGNASGAVAGSIWYDSSAGQLKYSDGTTAQVVGSASGGAGGISSFNGLTALTQTFAAVGTSGSGPNWASSGSAHTLNIPLASSPGVSAGLISTTQYDSFNSRLSSALNSGQIFVGSTGNLATGVTPTGDLTITPSGSTTLASIRGQAVDATVPIEGQVFRWTSATKWTPAFLSMADVRSTATPGNTIFPTTSCTTGQTLNWSSLTDTFVCNSINIGSAQVNYGSAITAGHVFAAPSGSAGAPTFRALVSSDLPAGVSSQWATSGANIFYGTGNVGIGTATPDARLHVTSTNTSTTAGYHYGSVLSMDASPGSASSASAYGAHFTRLTTSANGVAGTNLVGTEASAHVNGGTGTIPSVIGVSGTAANYATRTVTTLTGGDFKATINSGGTITNAMGVNASVIRDAGTIGNAYGVYIGSVQGTNNWSIYANDPSAPSYFGGAVGIGSTVPAAKLDIASALPVAGGSVQSAVQSATDAATGIRSSLTLRNNGTGGANEYILRGLNAAGTDTSAIRQDGSGYFMSNVSVGMNNTAYGVLSVVDSIGVAKFNSTTAINLVRTGGILTSNTASNQINFRAPDGSGAVVSSAQISSAGTVGGTFAVGSIPQDLVFSTGSASASERLRIVSNGNVGIGVSSPAAALDIVGTSTVNSAIIVPRSTTATRPSAPVNGMIRYNTDTPGLEAYTNGGWSALASSSGSPSQWATSGSNIFYGTGNVGIGTATPSQKLHVEGDAYVTGAIAGDAISIVTSQSTINSIGGMRINIDGNNDETGTAFTVGHDSWNQFYTVAGELFRVQEDGRVGIGRTNPQAALDVNGAIKIDGASATCALATQGSIRFNTNAIEYCNTSNAWTALASGGGISGLSTGRIPKAGSSTTLTDSIITENSFNIGIGTASPATRLHVAGTVTTGGGGSAGGVTWLDTAGTQLFDVNDRGSGNLGIRNNVSNQPITFHAHDGTGVAERVRITGTGNVGIGTNNPSAKLSVAGAATDNAYFFYDNASLASNADGQSLYIYRRDSVNGDASIRLYNDQQRQAHLRTSGNGNLFIESDQVYIQSPALYPYASSSTSAYYPNMAGPYVGTHTNLDNRAGGLVLRTGNTAGNPQHSFIASLSNTSGYAPSLVFGTQTAATAYEERMRIDTAGNVGIGTTNPGYKLDVVGDINASANVRAAGVILTSDSRFKRNIQVLDNSLAKILRLRGVRYNWRTEEFPNRHFNHRDQVGVIAQEVEAEFPELVVTSDDGFKAVNYPALVSPLIESTKELYGLCKANEVENLDLKKMVANLEDRAARAERENAELRSRLDRIEKLLQK